MREIALLGMPNCGKSSIFRLLTGKHVPTGNRSGVTVKAVSAPLTGKTIPEEVVLTDLPGIRSPSPSSEDEQVTMHYLLSHKPDLLIAVMDATDLTRQFPVIRELLSHADAGQTAIALNFCDELETTPDRENLTALLGVPVFPVSARTGEGIHLFRQSIGELTVRESPEDSAPDRNSPRHICTAWDAAVQARTIQILGKTSARRELATQKIDRFLLTPAIGFPLFLILMALILFLVFGAPGELLCSGFTDRVILPLSGILRQWTAHAPLWLSSLLTDGILNGIGAVLSFLPRLLILFLIQSVLEQSGFLARMTQLFDPVMRRFGLRGDAVTPLLLGFGCTVPALLCTRAMKDCHARKRCACYLPAVACSARMPLCLLISDCFFPGAGWAVCAGVWVGSGICFLLLCAGSARLARQKSPPVSHCDPLPRWRLPAWQELLTAVCDEIWHFLRKAGGLIFLFSVLIWLLSGFRPGVAGLVPADQSLLAMIGKAISPLFAPLGLSDWRIVAALLAGIGAKEASLSTLAVLFGGQVSLTDALPASGILNPAAALALLVFYTLYFPCLATLSTMRPSERRALWIFPIAAYLLAFATYHIMGG